MTKMLLIGRTEGGTLALLIEDATWRTVASVADGLQDASRFPITWTAREVPDSVVGTQQALSQMGLLDRPLADVFA